MLSYLPKATVQASIGAIALSEGLPCGKIILTAAVISIMFTAPVGALLMGVTYKKLLEPPVFAKIDLPPQAVSANISADKSSPSQDTILLSPEISQDNCKNNANCNVENYDTQTERKDACLRPFLLGSGFLRFIKLLF